MLNKKLIVKYSAILLLLPVITFAVTFPDAPGSGLDIETALSNVIDFIWPIFGGLAIIMFIAAGFLFLTAQGDPHKVAQARMALIWGIVGVAIALSSTTIPYIVSSILGV